MNGLKQIVRFLIANFYPRVKPLLRLFNRNTQSVKVVVLQKNKILLIRNTYRKGWTLPGGGIKRNESPRQAAIREVKEEVKITITDLKNHGTIKLDFEKNCFVTVFSGIVKSLDFQIDGLEIEEARWVNISDLSKMALLPVASCCIKLLKLTD